MEQRVPLFVVPHCRIETAEAELEIAERCERPQLEDRHAGPLARLATLDRVRAALLFTSLPGLEPCQAAEPERQPDILTRLARECDAFAIRGVSRRPLVRRRPVPRDVTEELRQRAERRPPAHEVE